MESMIGSRWRLEELDLYNFGVYNGYWPIRLAQASPGAPGSLTLIGGKSGTGKTTVLDALSLLISDQRRGLNRAADDGGGNNVQRTAGTYVLGTMKQTGDGATSRPRCLRRGALENDVPVSGAVAGLFVSALGERLSLAQFYWVAPGEYKKAEVVYLVSESPLDITLFGKKATGARIDTKAIRELYPDHLYVGSVRADYNRVMREHFGIDKRFDELSSMLLTGKVAGDFADVIRDVVLDEPRTIAEAAAAAALSAHRRERSAVAEQRAKKRRLLESIDTANEDYKTAQAACSVYGSWAAEELSDSDKSSFRRWWAQKANVCVEAREKALIFSLKEAKKGKKQLEDSIAAAADSLEKARKAYSDAGGDALTACEKELEEVRQREARVKKNYNIAKEAFDKAGEELPCADEETWKNRMTLLAGAAQAYDTREASSSRDRERLDAAQNVKDSTALVNSAENDLDRAKRGTRIDELMDRSREVAARATGIDPSRLPYLAELIDVDGEDNKRYRVAMNVAWKSIADTVLVSGDELSFRRDLESIDPASIGRRLKYRFVGGDDILSALPSTRRDGWLSSKIKVDPSSPLGGWVMAYLSDPKNDFYVVEDGEFKPDNNIQQVSVKGQVKIGRKGEYGRGQRPVDFIGFADEAYIAAKEASLVSARDSLEKARNKEREVIERQRRAQAEFDLYNTLRSFEWKDVAVVAAEFAVNRAEEAVNSLKTKNLDKLKANVDSLENEKDCLNKKLGVAEKAIEDDEADMSPVRTTLSRIEQDMGEFVDLLAPGKELLRAFEDAWDVVMTGHESLSEQGKYLVSNDNYLMKLPTKFKTEIGRQLKSKREARLEAENKLLSAIGLFRESCGEDEIEGLSENIAAVDEYLALRANYGDDESIDLPAWIREFIEKLHKLIDLTSEYEKRCKSSFDTINNILLRHAFNDLGEHFRISARFTGYSDRWAAFRDEVRKISESYYNKDMSQWSDDAVATAFDEVASCVDKLAPENGKMAEVLSDPRIRFVFKGEVFGEDGKVPEVITSAAGMNGGKREKTIAFVLAAAIYSALGVKEDKSLPYTLIPIDEAFVKSDSETTSVSLDTLRNFGFQLLVVAPEEKFQTIEAICDRFYITGRANEESAAWIGLPTDNVTEEVYGDSEA